ncbi:MAG: ribbon-helix-helix domain-containing protein [Candidatus Heimdallarchaeota archaeon]
MSQVQLRLPEHLLRDIDKWIEEGKYKSRSDAIRIILAIHQEREETREFYKMLDKRSHESKTMPEILIPFTD